MSKNNSNPAEEYYKAMGNKDIPGISKHLHPEVEFIGPIAGVNGKEAVVEAAEGFMPFFESLEIRACLNSGDKAMIAYDVNCPMPIGKLRAAALMDLEDGLIKRLELFFDASPFEIPKNSMFSS